MKLRNLYDSLCEACMEEVYNLKYSYSEDYEPSDGEMEAWIDEQILADELKLDQL